MIHNILKIQSVYSKSYICTLSSQGYLTFSTHHLQLFQNSAAKILTRTKKHNHTTPILAHLHWLMVAYRVDLKILLITLKAQRGLAPRFLVNLLVPYVPSRSLRASDASFLVVPRSKYIHRGDKAFAVRAPKLWNDLPEIRAANSVSTFIAF